MNIVAIIPARMAATRFPGKPMKLILNMPMIGHVYHRTNLSKNLLATYVATCDDVIFNYIKSIGGNAVMTSDKHTRCTDRTSEALIKIEKELNKKIDLVVMVQGDEPMVTPEMIDLSLQPFLKSTEVNVVNLMGDLESYEEAKDPNEVKVVVSKSNKALYFSREAIPSDKKYKGKFTCYKQICIIPFKRDFLIKFNSWDETPLEIIESVDMMRVLENDYDVDMVFTEDKSFSVDTQEDLDFVETVMKNDNLISKYLR